MTDAEILKVLSAIESGELPLLTWGVTSGSYSEPELLRVIAEAAPGGVPDDILDTLLSRGMLVSRGLASPTYRSRMAETVRLAVNLRQWFHGGDWRTARTLVSDMRFLSRTRTIPIREVTADQLDAEMAVKLGSAWTGPHHQALQAILGARKVARFQMRSFQRIATSRVGGRGTVVSAGTGSGKTMAFYLPVLTLLLATPRPSKNPRVVAIYPRTELLRDQLSNLIKQTRGLSGPHGVLSVGVLYGATPYDRSDAERQPRRGWRRRGNGLASPMLGCLQDGCGGAYIWPDDSGDDERLICETCGDTLGAPHLRFTRKSLLAHPPDILFTTTEMVNRLLGTASRRLLVGDAKGGPEFVLLDEIHTYSGTHGAQVANLLRRWRSGFANAPHIVGLSATLADPAGFLSTLTGLSPSHVANIAPQPDEMETVGREYLLALRGDPASQTSLLSTTIQTAMLMRRMLDLTPGSPSHGAFGSKLFAFTDDLDITNRLHSQLQDAEGWRQDGVNRSPRGGLATLRSSAGQDVQARDQAGQVWAFAEEHGTLQHPVRVSRTTSRDAGVDAGADIVVATASLEVGFDDPSVGAVLQHKAPRDAAQFLQRRGRAGRDPVMRPWTVVVLSDFGRDRLAFQSYEALFEPVVRAAPLPVRNRVILKMQAAWHLADQLERVTNLPKNPHQQQSIAPRLKRALLDLLTESGIARFSRQLRWALALDDEDVRAVMWDHPRGIITSVVPTLLRSVAALERGQATNLTPLREFLPPSLFAALQTPEVRLSLPAASAEDEGEPISMAMRQFAPGRVSYRYAQNGRRDRLWVAPPPSTEPDLDLRTFATGWYGLLPPSGLARRMVQVTALTLQRPPGPASDSSYGRWRWESAFAHDGFPLALDIPAKSVWSALVTNFEAYTHRYRSPMRVWRFSGEVEVERNDPQEPVRTIHALTLDDHPVSAGFNLDVDGLEATVSLPRDLPADEQLVRALRVTRMEFLARSDPDLQALVPSQFTRDWLQQVLLTALVTGGRSTIALADVLSGWSDVEMRAAMLAAAQDVFGADPNNPLSTPGLVQDLTVTLQTPEVVARLRHIAMVLWADPDDSWLPWLRLRHLTTLGAAMVQGVQALCPDVDSGSLRLDLDLENQDARGQGQGIVRLTEDEPGGIGVIETFIDRYVEDPRSYWALVASALGASDAERVNTTVTAILKSLEAGEMRHEVSRVRQATGLSQLTDAWDELRLALFNVGLPSDTSITSALATRTLRPGSTEQVDTLALRLLAMWGELESAVGVEIDLRVFAYVAAQDSAIRARLQTVTQQGSTTASGQIGQIVGLLWPRGFRIRASALDTYNPYVEHEPTEPLLLAHVLTGPQAVIDMTDLDWREQVDRHLGERGTACLRVRDSSHAADALSDLMTRPTAVDVLEVHPRVVAVQRGSFGLMLTLEFREAHQ